MIDTLTLSNSLRICDATKNWNLRAESGERLIAFHGRNR
jgi:hypothetical protein